MKQLTYLLLGCLLTLMACKKENTNPTITKDNDYTFNTEVGSYWVYQNVYIDADGNETIDPDLDTMFIIGDTVINGNTYNVKKGQFMGVSRTEIYRDSLGYIVNHEGDIQYAYNDFVSVLSELDLQVLVGFSKMEINTSGNIEVPAGSFETIINRTRYTEPNGDPINNCGDMEFLLDFHYDKEIGLVRSNCCFINDLYNCAQREQRLVAYYIP